MKKVIFSAVILLTAIQFSSCKKETKNKETQIIAQINDSEKSRATVNLAQKPVVFITGKDTKNSTFYNDARVYFDSKDCTIVEGKYSLEEIIDWMNKNNSEKPFGEVHIVVKNNPFKALQLETLVNGEKLTTESLRKNITLGALPVLNSGVTADTKIVFHSQGLGADEELLKTLKDALTAEETPKIIASSYYNIFGGEFKEHYLAKPHYVYYPTANSPGKVDLSKEIAKKYADEKEINWYDALNNEKERYVGEPYTIQFNVPVKFELDYTNSDNEIPKFTMQEQVMDWVELHPDINHQLEKTGIPVDKYRWQWTVKNNTLTLKGKSTVLCVLKPLIKPYGDLEHEEPDITNKRLYAMK